MTTSSPSRKTSSRPPLSSGSLSLLTGAVSLFRHCFLSLLFLPLQPRIHHPKAQQKQPWNREDYQQRQQNCFNHLRSLVDREVYQHWRTPPSMCASRIQRTRYKSMSLVPVYLSGRVFCALCASALIVEMARLEPARLKRTTRN